jgi:hypothetical protein
MPDVLVVCVQCQQRWRYLCEECGQEKFDQHRRDTGHAAELRIIQTPKHDLDSKLADVVWP